MRWCSKVRSAVLWVTAAFVGLLANAHAQPKALAGKQSHPFHRSDYGETIQGIAGTTTVWWCDATWKVSRARPVPQKTGPAARLAAARNDREAVQIVVCPAEPLKGLTASAGPLAGPNGAVLPADKIEIFRVYYHFVEHPTDRTGLRDWWPDALPPLDRPIDVPAHQNQPLWILVHVPEDAVAGDYSGSVALKAEGWSAEVPLSLHVWDFALPRQNHLETALGLSEGTIFRYHQLQNEQDKRKVLDLYFQSFAEHRISPYNPTPLDPIRVKFIPEADPPRAAIDFAAFDRAMAVAIQKYHFTNFNLPIQGMGGGSFHARHEPRIGRFSEDTPEYQALFASQVRQLEEHLRQKGWLQMAYVYWFDEPEPKDYAFVRSGMERLKRYAPGIQRMLTEEPTEELAGAVDIWCPLSVNYNHQAAEKRRAQGERFWWYVCTGPKAPYCTLFIDHPATELRVWLWQSWQRRIAGILIWSTNWWTSPTAFPDRPQNPYQDPMAYVSGYGVPKGTKRFWGNGDGRFLYPPEAAAEPGLSGPGPVIAPPVSSIRWEMLREGVEDYEFLSVLRELVAQKRKALPAEQLKQYDALLEVPESITRDMTTFTADPAPIYTRRAAIAEAIQRLAR
ncbi:MAG: glycoside hydrolase domain-containing protein [Thermoguttaceae bacterium]